MSRESEFLHQGVASEGPDGRSPAHSVLTLPAELRRRYDIDESNAFTSADLGEGTLLLTSQVSRVAHLGDQVARSMDEEDVSVDEILETLDEEPEAYCRASCPGLICSWTAACCSRGSRPPVEHPVLYCS